MAATITKDQSSSKLAANRMRSTLEAGNGSETAYNTGVAARVNAQQLRR